MMKSEILACLDKASLTWSGYRVEKLSLIMIVFSLFGVMAAPLSPRVWGSPSDPQLLPQQWPINGPTLAVAQDLMEKKKWPEAINALRTLLKADPKSLPILLDLATALTHNGKREEALTLLIQARDGVTGSQRNILIRRARVLACLFLTNKTFQVYQEGLNFILLRKYRNANEKFERALSEEPGNAEILTRLGQSLVMDDHLDEGIVHLKMAKKLNPFEPQVHLWLGRALSLKGVHGEGIPELRRAFNGLPGSEQATVWLAEALAGSGQTNAAIRLLNNDTQKWPFHRMSLMTSAKIRLQTSHPDSQSLGSARKELQLAMSLPEQSPHTGLPLNEGELSIDLRKQDSEIKEEIQKLLNQVQAKLAESNR